MRKFKKAKERETISKFLRFLSFYFNEFENFVCEMKYTNKNSIPFSAIKPHQIDNLLKAKNEKGLAYKIPDSPIFKGMKTRFNQSKPFDFFFIKNINAYIGLCFHEKRKKRKLFLVDIESFLKLQQTSKRKSITLQQAELIADKKFLI